MTKRIPLTVLALLLSVPLSALAQSPGPVVGSLKGVHDTAQRYIMETAETVPENLYSYRPTEEVRSLGEILAHVANAQFAFCSGAAGEESPASENYEETRTTKAQIVEALQEGFDYCEKVYGGMSDADGANMVQFFGQEMAASAVLAFNTAHNYEHYGNLVTYMRINGITPPSTQMQGG
jgi:uncharacterized damage-inducible protein DinB